MPWRIDIPDPPPNAADLLIDLGALDIEASPGTVAAILPDNTTADDVQTALGPGADIRVSPAIPRDDGSVWILSPRPVHMGRIHLDLTDSAAFGTGHHPTTTLCLEALEELLPPATPPPAATMLDVGTGTGILALAALQLGIASATGIDIDAQTLEAASANARLNQLEHRLHLQAGGPDAITGTWPLTAANILTSPLIEMAPDLVKRISTRGWLILSGIRDTLAPDVAHVYRNLGLRHMDTRTRDGWAMLLLQASW